MWEATTKRGRKKATIKTQNELEAKRSIKTRLRYKVDRIVDEFIKVEIKCKE